MTDNDDLEQTQDDESFAELFEQSQKKQGRWLEPGQKVTARVLKVSAEWIFIDTGQKGEGGVDRKEFLDLDGTVTIQIKKLLTVNNPLPLLACIDEDPFGADLQHPCRQLLPRFQPVGPFGTLFKQLGKT